MPISDELRAALAELSQKSGHDFMVSQEPVQGTQLYVVYAHGHALPDRYTPESGTLGFRVPSNYSDAAPEDSFFIQPGTVKLRSPDPIRNSCDLHRAAVAPPEFLRGTELESISALVFSWHLWNKKAWDRCRDTLIDHYTHCLRRFEQPEHD